jgi:hypothetical protein
MRVVENFFIFIFSLLIRAETDFFAYRIEIYGAQFKNCALHGKLQFFFSLAVYEK